MIDLRQSLHDSLDDQHTDSAAIVALARVQGTRLRRRRRTAAVLAGGAVAVLAVVGLGTWTFGGLAGGTVAGEASPATSPEAVATISTASTLTGLEALEAALARVAPGGRVTKVAEMRDYEGRSADAYAKGALAFASDEDVMSSVIEVEYSLATTQSAAQVEECGTQLHCRVAPLADGSVLQTYEIALGGKGAFQGSAAGGTNLAAALLTGDVVVSVWVQVPVDAKGQVLSPETTLTMNQLSQVMAQPEWARLAPLG